ncbi:MAG: type V CRISPR-associated protein Cas12a/Cpf1, partial [bacterium]
MSQDNQKQFKSFEDFTNLYELSKTLRFELKPVGKTQNLIEEQRVFQKDEKVLDNYKIIKKYFDKLHKKFVQEALNSANLDFGNYKKAYFVFAKKAKDDRKNELAELEKQEVYLRKQIKNLFDDCAKKWKNEYNKKGVENKKDDIGILFEKEALDILKYEFTVDKNPDVEFPEEDGRKKNIFEFFKGFTTYFTNFHNSRKNFYKDDGTASAIPTRIINDNLRKFIENSDAYSHACHKIDFTEEEKNIFNLNFYNQCFLQTGIDKYNKITGDINSKINKYRQDEKEKMPFLKILYKQILEDAQKQETEQDDFIEIGGNEDVFAILEKFIDHNENNNKKLKEIFNEFVGYSDKYDLNKIYLANRFVNTISSKWFKGWELFGGLILEKLNEGKPKSKQKNKLPDFIPFFQIKKILESTNIEKEDLFREDVLKSNYKDKNAYEIFIIIWKKEFDKNIDEYGENLKEARAMMVEDKIYTNKKEKINGEEIEIQKEKIKNYSDSALAIYQIMKYFALEKGKKNLENDYEIDAEFYNKYNNAINEAKTWLYYNEFRNFLTKKPFNEDKIKLNFENGTLLDGWDKNKEKDNYGVILKKDDWYYLGLMLKKSNKIFDDKYKKEMIEDLDGGYYEKMVYKFLPDPKKMLPKVCFSKKGKDFFKPSEELIRIKEREEFKINTEYFDINSLHKIIDYYKECLKKYEDWQCFDFINIKDTSGYKKNIGEFYKDIEKNSWKVWFEKVSEKYVNGKVDNGELYLFQIYNKDFSKESSGNKNLHTIYFENIFKEENIKKPIIKLNG